MIIHAVSIHTGGGKVLLDQLLLENTFGKVKTLFCDTRYLMPHNVSSDIEIFRVSPTFKSRIRAEFLLRKLSLARQDQNIICFSNLPPAFSLKGKVILYLQNALLIRNSPTNFQNLKLKTRISYEKLWLYFFWKNLDEVWVQTKWMKKALELRTKIPINVVPITPNLPSPKTTLKKYDLITVTGSAPHKRLLQLLKAWENLEKPYPSLLIITDLPSKEIHEQFNRIKSNNIQIKINATREEIFKYYEESKCLIITSKVESYCLPLYEALHFKLKIMAPNEDYVLEACKPDYIIDPENEKELRKTLNSMTFFLT